MLDVLVVLGVIALALAVRLSQQYQRERASHDLTAQALADVAGAQGQAFQDGVALGLRLGRVRLPEGGTRLLPAPVVEEEEVAA